MPRKSKPKKTKIPYDKIKFVFNNLDKSMLEEFDNSQWSKLTLEECSEHLRTLADKDFRLSFKTDEYSGGYQFIATCDIQEQESGGYATSARSNDPDDALRILIYKIIGVAECNLADFDNEFREVRG